MRANPAVGGGATIALATLVALANAGSLPEGHTPLSVAKLMAKEAGHGSAQLGYSVALFAVEAPAEKPEGAALPDVPTWIELIPAPRDGVEHVETRDWRAGFKIDPKAIVEAFNSEPEERRAKPLDWEHKGHCNWGADRNPAAGWIEELRVGDDGASVQGRIAWTDIGYDDVKHKRYRYISPVVSIRWPVDSEGNIERDGIPEATRLVDAALTNNPATYIRDLASTPAEESESENSNRGSGALAASYETRRPPGRGEQDHKTMLSILALTALGLDHNATDEQVSAAIVASTSAPNPSEPKTPASTSETPIADTIAAAVRSALAAELAPLRADVEALKAKDDATKSEILDTQLNSVLDAGVATFKVTPAMREGLLKMGKSLGVAELRAHIESLPSHAHLSQPAGKGEAGKPKATLSADQLEICRQLQISPEDFAKTLAAEAPSAAA